MSSTDDHANKGSLVLGISIFVTILAITAVILRFLSRKLSGAGYWWDDWLIIAALPWTLGVNICQFYSFHIGMGQHVAVLPPDTTLIDLKVSFWFELIYVVGIGLNKYSVLFFYRRIFPQKSLLVILQIVGSVVLAWQIAICAAFVWQCRPVRKAWDVSVPGSCFEVTKLWLGNAVPNIVTDLVIIALPLPLIWNLHISRSQKIALCGVFLTGGFVCAVSFIRLVAILRVKPDDVTWNYVGVATWSAVEPSIGLVSACLPSMRYLFKTLIDAKGRSTKAPKHQHVASSIVTPKWRPQKSLDKGEAGSFRRLNEDYGPTTAFAGKATKTRGGLEDLEINIPMNAIHVQDDVELTVHDRSP